MPVAGLVRRAALCADSRAATLAMASLPSAADEAKEAEGASLYRQSCASCHGETGKGDGPVVERLKTAPQPLTTLAHRALQGCQARGNTVLGTDASAGTYTAA